MSQQPLSMSIYGGAEREPSDLMRRLNQEALDTARKKIAARFRTAADLEELPAAVAQTQKQNAQAESQLGLAAQGKLEALKRAKDIMDESASKLNTLFASIRKVDEKIYNTNTQISNYEYLTRVHYARENINRVLTQVEFFAKVPETVANLNQILDNDPSRLKEVFIQALKLDSLRLALLKEMGMQKGSGARRRTSNADSRGKGDYSEESYNRVKTLLDKHLNVVPDLMKRIRNLIYGYIDRFMEVGAESPQDLVMAIEIVEMHQEYLDRRAEQNRRRAEAVGNNGDKAAMENYENFSEEIQQRVR